MSSAYGHYVRLLTNDERAYRQREHERRVREYEAGERYSSFGARFYYSCGQGRGANRCDEPAVYMTGYRYVTGRAGRVSSAERHRCERHAAAFARKHGLELPTAPSPRPLRTGGDAVADALAGISPSSGASAAPAEGLPTATQKGG